MASERTPDRPGFPDAAPADVEITIVSGASGPTLGERISHLAHAAHKRVIVGLVLAVAAAGALVAGVSLRDRARQAGGPSAQAHERGAAGVAAASGFPLRCLEITISQSDANYARADLEHTGTCWRFEGDRTVVFHRVDGAWRPLFRGVSYSCPLAALPAAVQTDLALCPVTKGPLGLV